MKPALHRGQASYRPSIDGLRALAVLSVLGYHAFPAWVPGGFIGVDVFFVISGFLISGILLTKLQVGTFSLATFYARRIRRIFPALIVMLIAVLTAGYFILWPGEYRAAAKHAAGGAGFIVNILLGQETGYFDERAETKPLLHLWSLGVEEQFYIFWPLLLWAGWKIKRHTGAAIALLLATSFGLNIWFAGHHLATLDFYSILSRFWELLAGGALAWASQGNSLQKSPRLTREISSLAGLLLILTADFALTNSMRFPGSLALLPVCGAVLMIAAGEDAFLNRYILANPLAIGVGLISYPLYLWHWPLLSFAQIISGGTPPRLLRIELIAAAFALAMLTYIFIEQPFRKNALGKKQIPLLLATMICIGGFSIFVYLSDGLPARFASIGDTVLTLDSARLIDAWQNKVRVSTCYLQDPAAQKQSPDCIEPTRPLLLLWGDSHAASLYPGLKLLQTAHPFGIAQLTQSGCPPLFGLAKLNFRSNCNALNQQILQQAAALKPAVILLAAAWRHTDYPLENTEIVDRLIASVATIRQAVPKATIIVIGPAPHWLSPLPALYRRALTFNHQLPPLRMLEHLDPDMIDLNILMSQRLYQAHIDYLSIQQQLCDAAGCLTRFTGDLHSLAFVDDGHIAAATSETVIGAFAPTLLPALGIQ